MSEEITLRIRSTKIETLTYRPDRKYHGNKDLHQIAREDVIDIETHVVDPQDLDVVYAESQTQYEVDVTDIEHDTSWWELDDDDEDFGYDIVNTDADEITIKIASSNDDTKDTKD